MKYTEDYSDKICRVKELTCEAEAVVIGAGAGLSASAGFDYSGKRFHENFHDFEAKYGFHDMYSGGFYPYETPEEYWAFWSRYVLINRYLDPSKPVYNELYGLVKNENYFVITTNVDHCFQKAGFDKERLFYTQGDYGLFQCSVPCKKVTYDNEAAIKEMVASERDMKIPPELVPKCPVCGKPLTMNLRSDDKFVEDEGWGKARRNYERFLAENSGKKVVFLELGVGFNTPAIIKYPFMNYVFKNENASYVCVNMDFAYAPKEIERRSVCLSCDIGRFISDMRNA